MLTGGICFGQIKSATITGRVTDASGAVVPGASVTAVNEGTKVPQQTTTSGTGDYTIPFLEAGTFDLSVTKEGFTTYQQTGIVVGVGVTLQLDAQLAVGRTATVVEVKGAGAAALQTETATVGDTVASQAIQELPDINHNPFYYATLQPGVTGRWELMDNSSAMSFGIGIYSHDDYSAFSVNGATAFSASITVDGVNIQGASWNESDIEPAPEAIQEVKTYTSDYDASLGRGEGAVAIVTKGGTNNFHGVVFGRLRNEALNANSFSNDVTGDSESQYGYKPIPKQAFKVIYYGGALGGPIKKDKAFFFFSWQGMAHNAIRQDLLNVPMNNQAIGDFSSPNGCPTAPVSGATNIATGMGTCINVSGVPTPVQVFDPFVLASPQPAGLPANVYAHMQVGSLPGQTLNSLVGTGLGDAGAIGPNGLFSYYPQANKFPTDAYNDNNYFFEGSQTFRSQVNNDRVDLTHGKNNLYFAGGIEWGTINTPSPWGKETPQFYYAPSNNSQITQLVYSHAPYGSIGDTIAISPTLIADVRFGVQRTHDINHNPVVSGVNYNNFDMPTSVQNILPEFGAAPDFSGSPVGQWTALNDQSTGHKNEHQTNYHAAASATKVKGNWTLKWGGEYLGDLTNTPNLYYTGGYISPLGDDACEYTSATVGCTGQNTTPALSTGWANLDDVFGAAYWSILSAQTTKPALEEQYVGLYMANTWKVTPRLTLNLGVRWDFQPGPTERHNMLVTLDPTATTNPICTSSVTTAAVAATAGLPANWGCQGAYYYAGLGGNSRRMWNSEWLNFGPRIGLAYRWHENTAIRAGYGLSYLPSNTGLLFGPYSYYESSWGLGDTTKPFGTATPAGTYLYGMGNPLGTPLVTPIGANPASPFAYGFGSGIYPRNYMNGYMQQYNFTIERKVGEWLFTVGYQGALGRRLPDNFSTNGENTALFNAPQPVISCYHSGINCPSYDSDVASGGGGKYAGGYLATGSDPFTTQVANPFNPTGTLTFQGPYAGSTIQRGLRDGPFPLFGNGQVEYTTEGYSSYNSLQLEAKHQFGHGLMMDLFYTWSKALEFSYIESEHNQSADEETSITWNQYDLHQNRRYGLDDIPGRFVANVVYQLPFGTGHSMNPSNHIASYLVSGWSFGVTEMDESGYPLDIYDDDAGALNGRPNRAPNEQLLLPKVDQKWYNGTTPVTLPDGRIVTPCNFCFLKYNPDAFIGAYIANPTSAGKYLNDTYWMGNSALNYSTVRDPSINNTNLTIRRNFKVTEKLAVELQANATNLLNHPNIKTYTADPGSMNLTASTTTNTSLGQGTNSSNYGTHGLTDFDNRQIEFQLNVRF
jgi:hypothetical protein